MSIGRRARRAVRVLGVGNAPALRSAATCRGSSMVLAEARAISAGVSASRDRRAAAFPSRG